MIHFHAPTRTFHLVLRTSHYTFQADAADRLVHLGWGPRPVFAAPASAENPLYEPYGLDWSFVVQFCPDEVLTFGDTSVYQETLKAVFADGVRDLRLRYADHEVVTEAAPGLAPAHGRPTALATPRQTLRVRLHDPVYPFSVTACYRLTPEHDSLERWLELHNSGPDPVRVETCFFAALHLPNGTSEVTSWAGTWAREFQTQRVVAPHGTFALESRSLQTGHLAHPAMLVNAPGGAAEESGTAYFAALAYSGSWRMALEHLPTGHVRLHAGYNPADFDLTLAPGETHLTPALVCGVSGDGWGGAMRRLHAFTCERVLPQPGPRPVLYNSWEATYFNLNEAHQMALARKAAAIGVELFCVDDGWFGARRHDRAGLGDWVVSAEVFPNGLEPLVAEVKRLGMQFGLWVEPEMVNPDSDLYRAHPDWVLHFPNRPRTTARNQLILDFGRPEVVEHIFQLLDDLVRRYRVDFFKWDMNRYATEPGSVAGRAIWRKHTEAVYGLMDRLRANHPHLAIQSCSGGGGRIDLGILARTEQVWVSDNTDAFDRILIQEGFSRLYPARTMEAWVTHEHNHITRRVTPLSLRFDVAMRGVLGIGSSLDALSDWELGDYARYIAHYKRIRHIVQTGVQYHLQSVAEHGASVVQYVLPSASEAVLSTAIHTQPVGRFRPRPLLRGLDPHATYTVHDREEHIVHRASGYALMTLGLPRSAPEHVGHSQTLHLKVAS